MWPCVSEPSSELFKMGNLLETLGKVVNTKVHLVPEIQKKAQISVKVKVNVLSKKSVF